MAHKKTIKKASRKAIRAKANQQLVAKLSRAVGKPAAARSIAKATTQAKVQTVRNEKKFVKRSREILRSRRSVK